MSVLGGAYGGNDRLTTLISPASCELIIASMLVRLNFRIIKFDARGHLGAEADGRCTHYTRFLRTDLVRFERVDGTSTRANGAYIRIDGIFFAAGYDGRDQYRFTNAYHFYVFDHIFAAQHFRVRYFGRRTRSNMMGGHVASASSQRRPRFTTIAERGSRISRAIQRQHAIARPRGGAS